jgi:hypothetical protein
LQNDLLNTISLSGIAALKIEWRHYFGAMENSPEIRTPVNVAQHDGHLFLNSGGKLHLMVIS